MKTNDNFSDYYRELLDGQYDCPDRIVLNAYFRLAQSPGGFRTWWRQLHGDDKHLDRMHMMRMAGCFSHRIRHYAKKHNIPLIYVPCGQRKDEYWEEYRPKDPNFEGIFMIIIGRAPAPVWDVYRKKGKIVNLFRPRKWPFVNHIYFHIIDAQWGHIIVRMCMYPPFGAQIILNGHEWVECQARKECVHTNKKDNCFVEGTDFRALEHVAKAVREPPVIGQLFRACDRWVYSSCLCFGLTTQEQKRTGFRYEYSFFQLEYSRNLLFTRGRQMEQVFQKMIDRTRSSLDVERLKTIFGFNRRPYIRTKRGVIKAVQPQMTTERPSYNLTIFKLRWGNLTLKIYDKGGQVLRIEVVAHNVKNLNCGTGMDKCEKLIGKMMRMLIEFLNTIQAAHVSFIDRGTLDSLAQPSRTVARRLAGLDMNKPRVRRTAEALLAMAPRPDGFTAADILAYLRQRKGVRGKYRQRHVVYDLAKFTAKGMLTHKPRSRYYRIEPKSIQTLMAYLVIREHILKPVLEGMKHPHHGRAPRQIAPIDQHYINIKEELLSAFSLLGIAA